MDMSGSGSADMKTMSGLSSEKFLGYGDGVVTVGYGDMVTVGYSDSAFNSLRVYSLHHRHSVKA